MNMNKVQDILQTNGESSGQLDKRRISRVSTGPMGKDYYYFLWTLVARSNFQVLLQSVI